MKCTYCGKDHEKNHIHFRIVSRLSDKGYPTHARKYAASHEEADKKEKKAYGSKSYNAMKKVDSKLDKHELAGKNFKSGKVEVSKKVPKKYRNEVAFHEKKESESLRKNEAKT